MNTYSNFDTTATPGLLTGIPHLDNLLSVDTGFQSAVIFLTGTSGAGKTTLSKVIQKNLVDTPTALYERETSSKSVAKQTRRVKIDHDNATISDETDYPTFTDFMNAVEEKGIKFIIIDSLQTAATDFERNNNMGENESQLEVLNVLMAWKKRTGGTAILIGMVKKDGDFSGLNKIKHLADCHLHLVFDEKKNVRHMHTTKNRDNSTNKLFYEFVNSDEVIVFYTEKEFELKGKKLKFDDYLLKAAVDFLSCIDKKHPSYKEIKKEYNTRVVQITREGKTKLQVTIEIAQLIDEVTKKYGV
jgi:predicted ATP-dependent serine protease